MQSPEKDIIKLSFQTDAGIGSRARIGLLVLQTDQTIEHEVAQLTAFDGVACYHARLPNDAAVSSTTLEKMEHELPQAARLLAPELGLTSIGYACTSGASIIGEARVNQILKSIHPGVPSSNPLEAAKAAFLALGVCHIGLVTPYTADVTRSVEDNFSKSGIAVSVVGSFYENNDLKVGKITEKSILKAAISVGQDPRCEAVFISCTSLRSAKVIAKAEAQLGKPVISSNYALAWHLLRLAGIHDKAPEAGTLFTRN